MRRYLFVVFQIFAALGALSDVAGAEATNPAHALAEKFANADKPAAQPAPAKPSNNYEKEMLEQARAEAAARQRSGESTAAQTAAPVKAAQSQPAPSAPAPPSAAKPQGPPPQHMQIKIEAKISAASTPPPSVRDAAAPRATVLVVLTDHAGHTTSAASSDPVVCVGEQCYVSTGADSEARLLARAETLSTKNTITNGAGACKGKAKCVYRGVSLQPGADLQIVDLGIVKHDRRESIETVIDSTCKIEDGHLECSRPLTAPDYRIWVVPESVANAAGVDKLEAALDDELPEENVALDGDK